MPSFIVLVFLTSIVSCVTASSTADLPDTGGRHPKFNIFQVVQFRNTACVGGTKNGTCYTTAECALKAGVASGTCAQGYGVCCIFTASCGQTFSQNCTYFDSSAVTSGMCTATICKCSGTISQMRLDFNNFVISGPSTSTVTIGKVTSGVLTGTGQAVTQASQCLTDTFSVSGAGSTTPPVICGTNTGQHMYVDVCSPCITLTFQLGTTATGTALATRQWSIKVNQYDCSYNNLAPSGCTQYYYGPTTATVQTYNFAGGQHLANQKQQICVRKERGMCTICWAAAAVIDFSVSQGAAAVTKTAAFQGNVGSICCGYGGAGTAMTGYDCVHIPGAVQAGAVQNIRASNICGRSNGLVTAAAGAAMTVCSNSCPFAIQFLSDNYEFTGDVITANRGFRLAYIQSATNC